MNQIFAKRLKNARLISGLSMDSLAQQIGLSKQMISKYEKGISIPDSTHLIRLSKALNKKVDYFLRPFSIELGAVEFRKKYNLSKRKQDEIKGSILSLMENYIELEDLLSINYQFKNPLRNLPLMTSDKVEEAANQLRDKWSLGSDPIHNIISILEDNEIKIIEIKEETNSFDGLSTYVDDKYPVIVVNGNFPIERKRFTLLHELAHLLLKIPEECNKKEKENICHHFAGALLLPQNVVIEEFGESRKNISLDEVKIIQQRFGISIKAIMYRLLHANVIDNNRLKRFFIKLSTNKELQELVDKSRFIGDESSERYHRLAHRALTQEVISTSKASIYLQKSVYELKNSIAVF